MDIKIMDFQETHKLCIVTNGKGYSYGCTWAIEKDSTGEVTSPTVDQIKDAWKTNRNSFSRYNGQSLY